MKIKTSLLFLVLTMFSAFTYAGNISNILVIFSESRPTSWKYEFVAGLESALARKNIKAKIYEEFLGAEESPYKLELEKLRIICDVYALKGIDLIVTVNDESFYSLTHCGHKLPFDVPVIAANTLFPDMDLIDRCLNICAIKAQYDVQSLFKESIRVFPERRDFVCLVDSSVLGRKTMMRFTEEFQKFKMEYPEYNLSTYNVQRSSISSIVRNLCDFKKTKSKTIFIPRWTDLSSFITKGTKAPVFTLQGFSLGRGAFGTIDCTPYDMGNTVANMAKHILNGESPQSLGVWQIKGEMGYDYKQLKFYRVDLKEIEGSGYIINLPFLEKYGRWILAPFIIMILALLALVAYLITTNRQEIKRRNQAQSRLNLQEHLLEQSRVYNNILSSISEGMINYNVDMSINFVNKAMLEMLHLSDKDKYPTSSYISKPAGTILKICKDGDEDLLMPLLVKSLNEQKIQKLPSGVFIKVVETNMFFPVSGEIVPIFSTESLVGLALVCHNVSERELLKRSFNLAIKASNICSWRFDTKKEIFYFSDNLLKKVDLVDSKMTVDEFISYIHPEDKPLMLETFKKRMSGDQTIERIAVRMHDREGVYNWWEFRSSSYDGFEPGKPYMYLGIAQDIQPFKDSEKELIEARDKAMSADKLKSAFLANMSHEIRTPLNAIVGFSELLKDISSFTPEQVTQFVDTINVNCKMLLSLVNEVLDLSRIEAGIIQLKLDDYNLNDLLREIYDSQYLNIPEGVEFKIDIPSDEEFIVRIDILRLKQVINNFINNAVKFTTEGFIKVGYKRLNADTMDIFVEDTGSGISPEAQKHIFDRFFKADDFVQGAGLGLCISHTIITHMGGDIKVSSEVGKGTRFDVILPVKVSESNN